MTIKSYLVFPKTGKQSELYEELKGYSWIQVFQPKNNSVIVIVTEASSDEEDKQIDLLNQMQNLDHYSLVSVFKE